MKTKCGALLLATVLLLPIMGLAWPSYSVIHYFALTEPAGPEFNLVIDPSGAIYGVVSGKAGSPCDSGAAYRLGPFGSFSILQIFCDTGRQAYNGPQAGLVRDAAGNLYGTLYSAGALGGGVVFEITVSHALKILHVFGKDQAPGGAFPNTRLTLDAAGNLYGTTLSGGDLSAPCLGPPAGCGVVFELEKSSTIPWTFKVLYSFAETLQRPRTEVIFDASGNLFGVAENTVYELQSPSWSFSVIGTFSTGVGDGIYPNPGLVFRGKDLYLIAPSTLEPGGGCGGMFHLTPTTSGEWNKVVDYLFPGTFGGDNPEGCSLGPGPTFDSKGNAYGVALYGGNTEGNGAGTVWKLTPGVGGTWTETTLHQFSSGTGVAPRGAVIFDKAGRLVGTASQTSLTNPTGGGVVYRISNP